MRKLIVVLLCLLTSCGFHWRGELPLAPPLHNLYLQTADPYGQLARNLIQFLKLSGVHIAAKPQEADTVLVILSETTQQQLLGISGTQQTRQYNLLLNVTFSVTRPDGTVLVPPQLITEVRTLTIKADQILAGSNEANTLYEQMRQAIIYDIMSRLSSKDIAALLAPATA
jgi:LPS-assembly lipoprotein